MFVQVYIIIFVDDILIYVDSVNTINFGKWLHTLPISTTTVLTFFCNVIYTY